MESSCINCYGSVVMWVFTKHKKWDAFHLGNRLVTIRIINLILKL